MHLSGVLDRPKLGKDVSFVTEPVGQFADPDEVAWAFGDDVARVRRLAGVIIVGVGWAAVNSSLPASEDKEQPRSQFRPYPRGGLMRRRSSRSRSTIAWSASPVAVLCKGSGSVSNHGASQGDEFGDGIAPALGRAAAVGRVPVVDHRPCRGAHGDDGLGARHWSSVCRQGVCGAWLGFEALRNGIGWVAGGLNRPHGGPPRSVFDAGCRR